MASDRAPVRRSIFNPQAASDRILRWRRFPKATKRELEAILADHYEKMNGHAVTVCEPGIAAANWIPSWLHDPLAAGLDQPRSITDEAIKQTNRERSRRCKQKRKERVRLHPRQG